MTTSPFEGDVNKPGQNVLTWVPLTHSAVDELPPDPNMSCLFVAVHLYLKGKLPETA